jgi:serine/threonine protein kinase
MKVCQPQYQGRLESEIYVLSHLPLHRNIVKLVSAFAVVDPLHHLTATCRFSKNMALGRSVMVVEYLAGGDLLRHLAQLSRDHSAAFEIFAQVVDAVAHIHKHGLVHNDIKADNVLLSADGTPKLCDFGLACGIGQPRPGRGSSLILAPELFENDGHKAIGVPAIPSHDVWSLGVLLFAMLTDEFPWRRAVPEDQSFFALQGNKFKIHGLSRYESKAWLLMFPSSIYSSSSSCYAACSAHKILGFRSLMCRRISHGARGKRKDRYQQ